MALYLLYRGIRDPRYWKGLRERLGLLPASFQTTGPGAIWFHAVSVGEVLSAVELIRKLRAEWPRAQIYVSTATLTGRDIADAKLAGFADGIFFAPLDYRSVVRRVLRRLRPSVVVVLETEIWPNLYRESKRAGASLVVVNGRISDRAFPAYRRWRGLFRHVLRWPDAILAQSDEDRRRYVAAGAPDELVGVAGNLKYDFEPPSAGIAPDILRFLVQVQPSSVWTAASTMPPLEAGDVDEDDAVLAAFQTLSASRPGLLLVLAPRRPDRFEIVTEKLARAAIPFVRRTALGDLKLPGVLLLDSIGELAALFERADVVFMGGTLAQRGGHNILEPAYFGKPVIVGPHMENFTEIAESFDRAGAFHRIDNAGALADAASMLLDDPSACQDLGRKAREVAMSKRGAAARIAEEIVRVSSLGVPDPPRTLTARIMLTPLSWLWRAGHRFKSSRARSQQRSLQTPVVSIGGLSMGGVGKSPMVAHIAAKLREAGHNPAILTRGYHRRSNESAVVVPRGKTASIEPTGDEAQTFIRASVAHVGIGADRFEVGRLIEQQLAPDIFLLDDGFQHQRLVRRANVVLIDALNPLGGGVFPLGRLREPLKNLARATVIVITRVEPRQDVSGIERILRRYNGTAPIFRSQVVPREWVDIATGVALPLSAANLGRVGAFCGLGAPNSFWRTLEQLDLDVAFRRAFRDHHRYGSEELRRLAEDAKAAGAKDLVTTEKDVMNLPEAAAGLVAPLRLLWLRIGIEIEKEDEFLKHIL